MMRQSFGSFVVTVLLGWMPLSLLSFLIQNRQDYKYCHSCVSVPKVWRFQTTSPTYLKSWISSDFDLSVAIYDSQLLFSSTVSHELSNPSFASFTILYIAGVLTSLSPCSIGMLPITLSYLSSSDKSKLLSRTIFYAIGLATAFAGLGLSAALAGQLFGVLQSDSAEINSVTSLLGGIFKVLVSFIYVGMGLNLLDILHIQFPSVEKLLGEGGRDVAGIPGGAAAGCIGQPGGVALLVAGAGGAADLHLGRLVAVLGRLGGGGSGGPAAAGVQSGLRDPGGGGGTVVLGPFVNFAAGSAGPGVEQRLSGGAAHRLRHLQLAGLRQRPAQLARLDCCLRV